MPTSSDTSIFIKESSSASTEPDESPLMTILSMSILGLGELLLEVLEGDDLATLGQLGGTLGGLTLLGNLASGTIIGGDRKRSPAVGTEVKPST